MKKIIFPIILLGLTLTSCLTENNPDEEQQNNINIAEPVMPLREVKSLEFFISRVTSDSAWIYLTEEKAKKQGITYEEMLKKEGEFLLNQDAEIVKIENEIIRSQPWVDFINKKAVEQGITLDSMIRNDAMYMYFEKLNKAK